jgi:hypothetical protein
MDLKEQRDTIEDNFKKIIKILENGSDDKVYGLFIPMFEDIMKRQFYTERNILIEAFKEFYLDIIIDEEVICERGFMGAYIKILKEQEDYQVIFKYQIMAFLFGFLETSLIGRDKEIVVKNHMENKEKEKKKNKNKKKREQKKRNKWKKPPSPSLDYKTYDWNIPSIPPLQYVF